MTKPKENKQKAQPFSKFEIELFGDCFEKWGDTSQLMMLIEECSELIQSVSKDLYRNDPVRPLKERLDHFAEEMADVQLMIDEFTWRYSLEKEVNSWRLKKERSLYDKLNL